MTTITKDYSYRNEHFTIVFDGKFYMTVNHKYIGRDGKTIKELHFNDLHPGKTVVETIEETKRDLDIQYYMNQGYSKAQAFSKVLNIPIEIAEELFS